MAVIQLDITELIDVLYVLSQRGIALCYSVESDGVYLYGSEHVIQEVDDILWAAQVVDGLGMMCEWSRLRETVKERV